MWLAVGWATNSCHIVENDCFMYRLSGYVLKFVGQAVHVLSSKRQRRMRDMNGVLVGPLEEVLD